ncbi:TetR/AcrR family transcriptional regulator [Novosphingobium sp. ZN18A2]|uniref:TetR/AcrR family transcriptional regulator n=1 Tax=Novosphingobium sp. ZN18A2 TaxID=3079861 RepID=UPI0030CCBB1E
MSDIVVAQMEDSPQQERSRTRIRRALKAAEDLLREGGPELCSIPEVAKASDVPRAAIYRYFPDRPALLAAMAAASMDQLGEAIRRAVESATDPAPHALFRRAVDETVRFFNADPVASILQFNGPFGAIDRDTHHRKSRLLIDTLLPRLPAGTSDETVALTIEIIFACLRYGYFRDGRVTPAIAEEALRAATAFLGAHPSG